MLALSILPATSNQRKATPPAFGEDKVVTLNPSGSYPTWIHRGLFDALRAAVNKVAKCRKVDVTERCADAMGYCPGELGCALACISDY